MLRKIIIEFLKLKAQELKEFFKGAGLLILAIFLGLSLCGGVVGIFIFVGYAHLKITPYVIWFLEQKGSIWGRSFEVGFFDIIFVIGSFIIVALTKLFIDWIKSNWRKATYIVKKEEEVKKRQKEQEENARLEHLKTIENSISTFCEGEARMIKKEKRKNEI